MAPLFIALVAVLLVTAPITVGLLALVSLVTDRRQRLTRAWIFALIYGVCDVAAVVAGFGLWLRLGGTGAMGDEAMQERHYRLISWLLTRLTATANRLLRLRVRVVDSDAALEALTARKKPIVVLSRHAGPGDSFLLVNELLCTGRRPRIVLKSALQLDPCIDLLGNRLPFCFVKRGGPTSDRAMTRIGEIAHDVGPNDCVLLFPEGGNFTLERRRRAITSLVRRGDKRHAREALRMHNVVAPKLGGVLRALQAAPSADVVFIVHSGLAGMGTRLWDRVPLDRQWRIAMFHVGAEDVPASDEARGEWLFSWWRQLDEWVTSEA